MEKLLKFKIFGDYAHFKKFYTTTSPLTFEIPPPPTIIGMISAIIGLDKNEYLNYFQMQDDYKISLSIIKPLVKVRWAQNLIDTKHSFWNLKNRTQIRIEFLKDPSYIIYFWHRKKEIYEKLKQNLIKHYSVYSLCLGLSELLANFQFLGEPDITEEESSDQIELTSILPLSYLLDESSINFEISREIFKVNYPIFMSTERIVKKREDILFERTAKTIRCGVTKSWRTREGENIVFF